MEPKAKGKSLAFELAHANGLISGLFLGSLFAGLPFVTVVSLITLFVTVSVPPLFVTVLSVSKTNLVMHVNFLFLHPWPT